HVRRHDAVVGDGPVEVERDGGIAHGTKPPSPGHSATLPKPSKRKRAYIGIDIGGTKSLYALFDERFEVLASEKLPTHPETGGIEAFDKRLRRTVKRLARAAQHRGLKVAAIGIGYAGLVDMRKGKVRESGNLTFLEGYVFRDRLERITEASVFVAND